MADLTVTLEERGEALFFGLWKHSNDKSISKDIPQLSGQYYKAAQIQENEILPFVVLSKDYQKETGAFELFIGAELDHAGLEQICLPAGFYAKMQVRPKLGFLWGMAVGEAKRYFYTQWLPVSQYRAVNLEYEYHTENSVGKFPSIDVIFAIEKNT